MSSKKKAAPPKAGHNARTLDVIASEINHLERHNVFAIGKLLVEARDGPAGEYGEWMNWVNTEFDWSYDTADNYINAHELSLKVGTIRNLRVPLTIIYDLADDHLGNEDNDDGKPILLEGDLLKATIQDLDKAAKAAEKPLKVADCKTIIARHLKSHLQKFFGVALPAWLDKEMLDRLPRDADLFRKVAEKLKAESPLTLRQIRNLIDRIEHPDKGDQQGQGDQQGDKQGDQQGESRTTSRTPSSRPAALARAARAAMPTMPTAPRRMRCATTSAPTAGARLSDSRYSSTPCNSTRPALKARRLSTNARSNASKPSSRNSRAPTSPR
jgi:hypothetical protein